MKIVDRYISIEYFGKKPRQCYERSCFIKHGETCRITPKKALFWGRGGGGGGEREEGENSHQPGLKHPTL